MPNCSDFERLIARAADDDAGIAPADRRALGAHLESCASCRAALDAQRDVARVLAERPAMSVPQGFSARLDARLAEEDRWLPLVNWRAWTVGLAPLAALLMLLAWLTPAATGYQSETTTSSAQTSPATFESWAASNASSPAAAAFLQPATSGDSLLEVVLTGTPARTGDTNAR